MKIQEFRLKNITEIKNYFIREIDQKILISKKQKKVCTTVNYFKQFLILAAAVNQGNYISAFPYFIVFL